MTTLQTQALPSTTPQWRAQRDGESVRITVAAAEPPQPADWPQRLVAYLSLPGVQVVGAKRLRPAGGVFSMGEFVVHPKGFHHHGCGAPSEAYRFPEEVDAIAGGAFVVRADAFDAAGGDETLDGALGALELCLRIRTSGGRCIAVPDVVAMDESMPQPDAQNAQAFHDRWGFDWHAADLDVVRERWAGSGLLWNVRFHGVAMPFEKYETRPAMHWDSYANVEVYRQRADHLAKLICQVAPAGGAAVLDLGCGDGLFSHLIAQQGRDVVGIDLETSAIEQARNRTSGQRYTHSAPQFVVGDGGTLPFDDASMRAVAMFDVIEHLPNPIAVLRDVVRVLQPGGTLVLSTPAWQLGAWSDPVYHVSEYTIEELTRQVSAAGLAIADTGRIGGVYRDLIVIAQRR